MSGTWTSSRLEQTETTRWVWDADKKRPSAGHLPDQLRLRGSSYFGRRRPPTRDRGARASGRRCSPPRCWAWPGRRRATRRGVRPAHGVGRSSPSAAFVHGRARWTGTPSAHEAAAPPPERRRSPVPPSNRCRSGNNFRRGTASSWTPAGTWATWCCTGSDWSPSWRSTGYRNNRRASPAAPCWRRRAPGRHLDWSRSRWDAAYGTEPSKWRKLPRPPLKFTMSINVYSKRLAKLLLFFHQQLSK